MHTLIVDAVLEGPDVGVDVHGCGRLVLYSRYLKKEGGERSGTPSTGVDNVPTRVYPRSLIDGVVSEEGVRSYWEVSIGSVPWPRPPTFLGSETCSTFETFNTNRKHTLLLVTKAGQVECVAHTPTFFSRVDLRDIDPSTRTDTVTKCVSSGSTGDRGLWCHSFSVTVWTRQDLL